jgi:hypothetical protein
MEMSGQYYHYNNLQWGPCYLFRSATTGKRLLFRANEIVSVEESTFGPPVLTSVGGCEYKVTSNKPEGSIR